MLKVYSDIDDALELWDSLNEAIDVYFPFAYRKGTDKKFMFIENDGTDKKPNKSIKVFLDKEEANSYRLAQKDIKVYIGKMVLGALTDFLRENCTKEQYQSVRCLLCTIDLNGTVYPMDILWSNDNIN